MKGRDEGTGEEGDRFYTGTSFSHFKPCAYTITSDRQAAAALIHP